MALLGMTGLLALAAGPARAADQFKQAADGAGIECSVSARELTRFALIDDQFASVSKISTGTPYNDFAVTNEPLRGDIYISVPETYAAGSISFFATTKKGYVYKIACRVEPMPAAQVFITNPAIATNKAASWESETPLGTSADSTPANAKTSSSEVRATSPADGHAGTARCSARIANSPPIATSSSGTSLAAVATVFSRAPRATPPTFTSAQNPNVAVSSAGAGIPAPGNSCVTLAAKTVPTAAVANSPRSQRSTPARNAAYGPSATAMSS